MATLPNSTSSVNRHTLLRHIARQRDRVRDLDLVVDDTRQAVDGAVDELRVAVRERDRAAGHLAQLIGWHDELAARIEVFGPETVARHVTSLITEAAAR